MTSSAAEVVLVGLGCFSNDRCDVFVEDFCGDFLNDDSAGR